MGMDDVRVLPLHPQVLQACPAWPILALVEDPANQKMMPSDLEAAVGVWPI